MRINVCRRIFDLGINESHCFQVWLEEGVHSVSRGPPDSLEPEETEFVVSIRLRMGSIRIAAAKIIVVETCGLARLS